MPSNADGERNEKITLGITTLLSMSILLLMVSDSMPTTSAYVPLIGLPMSAKTPSETPCRPFLPNNDLSHQHRHRNVSADYCAAEARHLWRANDETPEEHVHRTEQAY